ncbi:type II secretion system protein [Candidatus Saccharibacteria bacterium]|nr:type II secretion system protein [Candidatus Saccharibacteria bacterium]
MKKTGRQGFTLIELALSLIFIAILSVTVVLLIQNTAASYRRGVILGQVNTVGMDLIDDFRVSVQNATSDPVTRMCEAYYEYGGSVNETNEKNCKDDNADSFISVTKTAEVKVEGKSIGTLPVYGAFCTGTYTYIWNSGYFESAENIDFLGTNVNQREVVGASRAVLGIKDENKTTASFEQEYDSIRLLKIYDTERSVCINKMREQNGFSNNNYVKLGDYSNDKVSNEFIISSRMLAQAQSFDDGAVELMYGDSNSPNDLVLYELYVAKPALSSTRVNQFYAASFVLGTRRGGINIKEAGNSCKPPTDEFTELEYCAINKFNFAVQAGGA